jgi:hypothetical protein
MYEFEHTHKTHELQWRTASEELKFTIEKLEQQNLKLE